MKIEISTGTRVLVLGMLAAFGITMSVANAENPAVEQYLKCPEGQMRARICLPRNEVPSLFRIDGAASCLKQTDPVINRWSVASLVGVVHAMDGRDFAVTLPAPELGPDQRARLSVNLEIRKEKCEEIIADYKKFCDMPGKVCHCLERARIAYAKDGRRAVVNVYPMIVGQIGSAEIEIGSMEDKPKEFECKPDPEFLKAFGFDGP